MPGLYQLSYLALSSKFVFVHPKLLLFVIHVCITAMIHFKFVKHFTFSQKLQHVRGNNFSWCAVPSATSHQVRLQISNYQRRYMYVHSSTRSQPRPLRPLPWCPSKLAIMPLWLALVPLEILRQPRPKWPYVPSQSLRSRRTVQITNLMHYSISQNYLQKHCYTIQCMWKCYMYVLCIDNHKFIYSKLMYALFKYFVKCLNFKVTCTFFL